MCRRSSGVSAQITSLVTLMLIVMTLFEVAKQVLHPDISAWESHLTTIVFSTVLAAIAGYLAIRNRERVNQRLAAEAARLLKLENALRASEERFRSVVASAQDAIIMIDDQGRITLWNRAAELVFGYPAAEALGRCLHEMLAPERYHKAYSAAFSSFRETGRGAAVGRTTELAALHKDGTELPIELSLSAVRFGELWHAIGIARDIAQRKRAEADLVRARDDAEIARRDLELVNSQLEQAIERANHMAVAAEAANCAKSAFLANMSHEIRTPMTAILGFAETLLDPGLSESERLDAIHTVRRNGEHLLSIINDILDLSKIETGAPVVERIACSPGPLVAQVAELMRVRTRAKNLAFDVEYVGPLPETVQTDPTRLKQILFNVLGNAIKFTEQGGVRLVGRFVAGDSPVIQFDVVDTGIGMTPQQAEMVFEPFAQADASVTRRFGGTGLGLSISKRLARALGGDVVVIDTQPGIGTRFRITISTGPVDGVAMVDPWVLAAQLGADEPEKSASPVGLFDHRVLLAEDGPDNQKLIAHILRKAGADVTVADNGRLAVDAVRSAVASGREFDLILMDMQMPVMDGYEAVLLLRQQGYAGTIVALTAHAMTGDRDKCISVGCDDYLVKPVDPARLVAVVADHGRKACPPLCEPVRSGA